MKRYHSVYTKQFRKDLRRLEKSGFPMAKLEEVVRLLEEGKQLNERYRDHLLHGMMRGMRECHVGPDWLLLYQKDDDALILLLIRTGDHRHVLGME